jgi:hypothetical protein
MLSGESTGAERRKPASIEITKNIVENPGQETIIDRKWFAEI